MTLEGGQANRLAVNIVSGEVVDAFRVFPAVIAGCGRTDQCDGRGEKCWKRSHLLEDGNFG